MADRLKEVRKEWGFVGLYVLQSMEIRAAENRKLRFEMSSTLLLKFIDEIDIVNEGKHFAKTQQCPDYINYVREIIKLAKNSGYLVITSEKDKNYISFPHIKSQRMHPVLKGKKQKVERILSGNKPSKVQDIVDYISSLETKWNDDKINEEAAKCFDYWEERKWQRKGNGGVVDIKDWKATVRRWIRTANERLKQDMSSSFKNVL